MPKKHRKNMQRSEKIIQYCMLIFWFCINNLFLKIKATILLFDLFYMK